jgi:hypothetical protein
LDDERWVGAHPAVDVAVPMSYTGSYGMFVQLCGDVSMKQTEIREILPCRPYTLSLASRRRLDGRCDGSVQQTHLRSDWWHLLVLKASISLAGVEGFSLACCTHFVYGVCYGGV